MDSLDDDYPMDLAEDLTEDLAEDLAEGLAEDDASSSAAAASLTDLPDRVRGLWEALAYLEGEAQQIGGTEVGVLLGCARMALERRWGGAPPPEPGRLGGLH